eukprot:TRINITY_DN1507_c0_g1_i1.p1 TRINITY_DN1507_c0_g1~~TRINITY_DN1507_c0_g1_i1.p1  ORF type:complete len:98 (-),score=20.83 TRINITY_DN1507_c0_g1_i1:5-298(-)
MLTHIFVDDRQTPTTPQQDGGRWVTAATATHCTKKKKQRCGKGFNIQHWRLQAALLLCTGDAGCAGGENQPSLAAGHRIFRLCMSATVAHPSPCTLR